MPRESIDESIQDGKNYELVNGHKRLHALKKLKVKTAAVSILKNKDPKNTFLSALILNQPAAYCDLDRAMIIQKAILEFKFSDIETQNLILPLLGLAPSAKILSQYQRVAQLPDWIHAMIKSNHLAFQGSFLLDKFKKEDLDFLRHKILPQIRPTASQLAHLCEWLLDLIQTQKKPLSKVLQGIQFIHKKGDIRASTESLYKSLRAVRFGALSAKEAAFRMAADEIRESVPELEIRAPENFEQEGFFIQAHIRNPKSLTKVIQRLKDTEKQASALFDTLL